MKTTYATENTANELTKECSQYIGMTWKDTSCGILVFNTNEAFLLKMKGDKVRKVYHRNGRSNPVSVHSMRTNPTQITSKNLDFLFHVQNECPETSIEGVVRYIFNHNYRHIKNSKNIKQLLYA